MKYVLTVEKGDYSTDVVLEVLENGMPRGIRRFSCAENEGIHFTVHNGQLLFAGHTVKPPQSLYGPSLGMIS